MGGLLAKTYDNSFFVRFQLHSDFEKRLFSVNPAIYDNDWTKDEYSTDHDRPAVVIQCMCLYAGGKEIIAEVMWKEDFDLVHGLVGEK